VLSYRGLAATQGRRLAVLAASLTLLTAACGSGDDTEGQTSGADSPATTQAGSGIPLPADIAASGVLKVGTAAEGGYPFEFIPEGGGEIDGFEADIWKGIAAELGLKAEATSVGFDSLIPAVQSGRFDVAMAAISDHDDREEVVTFVDYMYSHSGIVVPDSNPHGVTADPLSLCGLTGGAARGTDYATFISDVFDKHCENNGKPEITLNVYPSETDPFLALTAGRIDFCLDNFSDAAYGAEKVHATIIDTPLLPKFYDGLIVDKDNTELAQAILAGLQKLVDSGDYEQILDKWKVTGVLLPNPGINLATTKPLPTPSP
jgi:polar amino acid transport system substrate-binding protein